MKLFKSTILFGGLLALAMSMNAQSPIIQVNVPFEFVAGTTTMPAGSYTIEEPTTHGVLLLRGAEHNATAVLIAVNGGPLQRHPRRTYLQPPQWRCRPLGCERSRWIELRGGNGTKKTLHGVERSTSQIVVEHPTKRSGDPGPLFLLIRCRTHPLPSHPYFCRRGFEERFDGYVSQSARAASCG